MQEDEFVAVPLQAQADRESQEKILDRGSAATRAGKRARLHDWKDESQDHSPLAQTQVNKVSLYQKSLNVETQDVPASELGHVPQSKEDSAHDKALRRQSRCPSSPTPMAHSDGQSNYTTVGYHWTLLLLSEWKSTPTTS